MSGASIFYWMATFLLIGGMAMGCPVDERRLKIASTAIGCFFMLCAAANATKIVVMVWQS